MDRKTLECHQVKRAWNEIMERDSLRQSHHICKILTRCAKTNTHEPIEYNATNITVHLLID